MAHAADPAVRPAQPEPVNVYDYERLAAGALDAGMLGYFAGGAGDELTLVDNVAAMRRWQLLPRVLVDVEQVSTSTSVLGTEISMPLIVAPVAMQRLVHPEGEPGAARAAAAAGTIFCLSTIATATPEEVAREADASAPRWMQLYCFRDHGVTRHVIDQAREHGYRAFALTVDAPVAGRRERDLRTGFGLPPEFTIPSVAAAVGSDTGITPAGIFSLLDRTLDWRKLERLCGDCGGLPLLVKGVHTAADAELACEHGAAGVIVSNHGGRQLDGVPATIDLLEEVVQAVGGRIEVLMDGGVRRGTDVLRALALGARAVLAGRAPLWGLTVDGEAGARRVLELLREEIALGLTLLGCRSPAEVTRAHVRRA
ncbi:MAG TPA: alpha-hydroxy acid oxidase [Solirubrobacteraceae bacterium]|jgi:isopentenyl diphosphate isomerase/L-lactate dehydrogenase-like FMN-dependent dehydrogenase|nr:alpha-hydroxy acid oxidase [Solirubrobacteraceae bacterium]